MAVQLVVMILSLYLCLLPQSRAQSTEVPKNANERVGTPGIDFPVRVVGGVWEPWVYPCAEWYPQINFEKCPYPGFTAEILHYVLLAANLSYEITPWAVSGNGDSWGKVKGIQEDGMPVFDGNLGLIANGTYDSCISGFYMNELRIKAIDFSFPVTHTKSAYGYATRRPSGAVNLNSATLLTGMFQAEVWAAFFICLVLITFLLYISRNFKLWAYRRANPEEFVTLGDYTSLWDTICMLLDEYHGSFGEGILAGNVIMVLSGLLCLFLHTTYEGYLVTQMLKDSDSQPFTGMRDLAPMVKSKRYSIITYSVSDFWPTQVMNGESEKHKLMKEALMVNKIRSTETMNMEKSLEMVNNDNTFSLVAPSIQEVNFPEFAKGRCNLLFIPDADSEPPYIGFLLQKNSFVSRRVFETMAGMIDFMVYIGNKYYDYQKIGDPCAGKLVNNAVSSLKVKHYYGVFFVGLFGVGSAFFMFACEYAYAKITNKKLRDEQDKLEMKRRGVRLAKNIQLVQNVAGKAIQSYRRRSQMLQSVKKKQLK